jgi:putative intracellular protease/amidase
MDADILPIGTICHSLWLFCADPELLADRKVTCAHNILSDVRSAGGQIVFDGDHLADTNVDGALVTARHPGVTQQFLEVYLKELDSRRKEG